MPTDLTNSTLTEIHVSNKINVQDLYDIETVKYKCENNQPNCDMLAAK